MDENGERLNIKVWPLAILTVILGVYPSFYLNIIQPAIDRLATQMGMPWVTGAIR